MKRRPIIDGFQLIFLGLIQTFDGEPSINIDEWLFDQLVFCQIFSSSSISP